jgi:hypothetical protein
MNQPPQLDITSQLNAETTSLGITHKTIAEKDSATPMQQHLTDLGACSAHPPPAAAAAAHAAQS